MKRLYLCVTLFLFLSAASACFHDWVSPAANPAKGEWQWTYSAGGVAYDSLAPINNTLITLSLRNDSTYIFYLNNETETSGAYSIQTTANARILHLDKGVQINRLYMEPVQQVVVWDSSQLQLSDYGISDGYHHYFKKIQ